MFETSSAISHKNIGFFSLCLTAFLLLFVLNSSVALCAEGDKPVEQAQEKSAAPKVVHLGPEDEFDRGVPRSSVKRFLEAAKAGDYEGAAQHLDLKAMKKMGCQVFGICWARSRLTERPIPC
jgi:hypothetical protein